MHVHDNYITNARSSSFLEVFGVLLECGIMKLALFCLIQVQCLAADDGKKSGGRRVGMGSMGKCIVYSSRKSALFAQSHGIQR